MPNQPKTPVRTVRVDDDPWLPAKAVAVENGTTIGQVIRDFLATYAKGASAVVCALVALVLLSGCGGSADGATAPQATSDVQASAIVQQQASAAASASAAVEDAMVRAAKGECVSTIWPSTEGAALKKAYHDWALIQDHAEQVSAAPAMLAMVPADSEACEVGDALMFQTFRDSIAGTVAQTG